MIPKYICPYCNSRLANIYVLISHVSLKHENPFKKGRREYWLNPTRRDSIDFRKLRQIYGNDE